MSADPKKEDDKKKKEETIASNGVVIKLSQSEIIRIVNFCGEPRTKTEIMEFVGAKSAEYFRKTILKPLVKNVGVCHREQSMNNCSDGLTGVFF